MEKIYFVTGNENKLMEARQILTDFEIENVELDLPELQGEREEVILEKAKLAAKQLGKPCFVDDTSLCFNALNGLPGVYIKHFLEKLGREGLFKLLEPYEDKSAEAVAMIGYCEPGKDPIVFEGVTKGKIVEPKGDRFGWDPVFQPEGYDVTYAEMDQEEKNKISHRKRSLQKFNKWLEEKNG
jgi:inosine triphosphate pyrophosphatase